MTKNEAIETLEHCAKILESVARLLERAEKALKETGRPELSIVGEHDA